MLVVAALCLVPGCPRHAHRAAQADAGAPQAKGPTIAELPGELARVSCDAFYACAQIKPRSGIEAVGMRFVCQMPARAELVAHGYSADVLEKRVGHTVRYDPAKAKACIDAWRSYAKHCHAMPGEGDAGVPQLPTCDEALVGLVPPGHPCEYDYECAPPSTKCDIGPAGTKVCKRPMARSR